MTQTAWLIERKATRYGPAVWWAGCDVAFDLDNERVWTKDANLAVKFADRQSAWQAMVGLLRAANQRRRYDEVETTEHMWPSPIQPRAASHGEQITLDEFEKSLRERLKLADTLERLTLWARTQVGRCECTGDHPIAGAERALGWRK